MKLITIALQNQISVFLGLVITLGISIFYSLVKDSRFPEEKPLIIISGIVISAICFLVGVFLSKKYEKETPLNLKEGAIAVFLTWIISILISAIIFFLAGFPDPGREDFSLHRRMVDSVFESVSGFTTAGGSILPSVEVFPRSILAWRSMTHFLGGMGMAYLAVTLWKRFRFKRETIINSESEGPNYTDFDSESDAREAGFDFMKIYLLLTSVLFILLLISGFLFREEKYEKWYDDLFDSYNYSLSVMGTGGFGIYDASAGLPVESAGNFITGGLQNPASEWIIAIFMFFAGGNLSLWFILFYKRKISHLWKSSEFKFYMAFVAFITLSIFAVLVSNNVYPSALDAIRYSFFNVMTILSTTGLATTDFTKWPAAAEGLLFSCYLVGGMVGSTSGGLKLLRFMVIYKYVVIKIKNLIYGSHKTKFTIDGITYDENTAGLIVANVVLYFLIFMFGAIIIMITSTKSILPDGTVLTVDFTSAITASIANLGNIGPAVEIGNLNAGPTGNYFAYSEVSKIIMSILMMIGRIGVITFFTLLITKRGLISVKDSFEEQHFDSEEPIIHS